MIYNIKVTQSSGIYGQNTIRGAVKGVSKAEALDRLDLLLDLLGDIFPGMFPNTSIVIEITDIEKGK